MEKNRVRQIFDRIAHRYDLTNDILSLGYHRLWERAAIRKLELRDGDRLLDLGAGSGAMTARAFAAGAKLSRAVLVDLSCEMLKLARSALLRHAAAECVAGDGEMLPLAAASVDAAILAYSLRNMPDRAKALAELHRVLRPGGRLVILEFSTPAVPLAAPLYRFYLRRVIPLIGGIVTGDRAAYDHLRDSIGEFPAPSRVLSMMRDAGFAEPARRSLTFGIASLYFARR